MLKVMLTLLILASIGLAQSSPDRSFSVHHSKQANFSLSAAQMRKAESLYKSACAVVLHDFHNNIGELHPRFTVLIGADRDEVQGLMVQSNKVRGDAELWMKKWSPTVFAQGVVVLAFDELLTADVINQLGSRAVRYSDATVNVTQVA
jgi:hypothetical protein